MTARGKTSRILPAGGFTLIEVLAAVAVIALSFVVLLSTEGLNIQRSLHASRLMEASQLAREKMEEALAGGGTDITSDNQTEGPFQWSSTVLDTSFSGLKELHVTVSWSEGRREESFNLAAFFLQ